MRGPEEAARLLAPLRALRPEVDTLDVRSAASVAHLQIDPVAPTAVYANSVLVGGLPERAVEALVATAGEGSGSDLLFVELRQLGGAMSRPAPRAGALDRMDGSFLVLCVGLDEGSGWPAVRENAFRVTRALQPWATGSAYLLMADADVDERRGWPTRRGSGWSTSAPRPTPTGCSCRPTSPPDRAEQAGSSRRQGRLKVPGPRW